MDAEEDEIVRTSPDAARIRAALGERSIVLVGLMGAGKSAIGRLLGQALDLPFLDADKEIETVSRMTIPELFEAYGEPEFRSLERRVIARILKGGPLVLATGGGAFMNDRTRRAIDRCGVSIWLSAPLDLLMERVGRKQNRPLLKTADPRKTMEKLMADRYPVYALADIEVESRDVRKDAMADEVLKALSRHLGVNVSEGVS
ncbi:MAG TPA: shikimate kinase [Rhizobiaceae bacterium]|nr:shikimate kinase [Rhizobiaceae bacterium]